MRTENLYYYGLDRLETGGIFSEKETKIQLSKTNQLLTDINLNNLYRKREITFKNEGVFCTPCLSSRWWSTGDGAAVSLGTLILHALQ